MHTVILGAPGWHTDELCRALADRGHTGIVLPYEGLVARLGAARPGAPTGGSEDPPLPLRRASLGASLASGRGGSSDPPGPDLSSRQVGLLEADAVLARIIPTGSLEQIIFRVDALHWIEERGVPVVNSPRAIERTVDKFYTDALLQEAGLPTPETVVCESADEAMAAIRAMGDVIVKPIFGSMGHGLVRVSDPDVAFRVVRSLEQLRAVFYVQRVVEHDGRDVRAFVLSGRVIGAIERLAPKGDWRTNVSRGGSARPIELPPEWARLAVRAAAVVGADYAGVDLLPSGGGEALVLEVNGIPGWRGLQQAVGVDVAGAIVDHLEKRVSVGEPEAEGRRWR